jgi:malate synthase
LVPLAKAVFDTYMPLPNQLERLTSSSTTAADLLTTPHGSITEAGLAINLDVGVRYLAAWLGGNGCVPIYNLMEDAATAEICRAQVWQWVRHAAVMEDGRAVTAAMVGEMMDATVEKLRSEIPALQLQMAASICEEMMTSPDFPEFLTLAAYHQLD